MENGQKKHKWRLAFLIAWPTKARRCCTVARPTRSRNFFVKSPLASLWPTESAAFLISGQSCPKQSKSVPARLAADPPLRTSFWPVLRHTPHTKVWPPRKGRLPQRRSGFNKMRAALKWESGFNKKRAASSLTAVNSNGRL